MKIILQGNPQSTNNIYKYRIIKNFIASYMSTAGKTLKEDYQWQMKSQYKSKPIETDVTLNIDLYFGDKRKRDVDNYNKLVLDAGTNILWNDDSQIVELTIRKFYCKENPRVELFF